MAKSSYYWKTLTKKATWQHREAGTKKMVIGKQRVSQNPIDKQFEYR